MRLALIASVVFLAACATQSQSSIKSSLSYKVVRTFEIGKTTEVEVNAILGQPTRIVTEKRGYSLRYDDPLTGLQRLFLNFEKDSRMLYEVLWLPKEDEPEYSLDQLRSEFKNAVFREIPDLNKNPHATRMGGSIFIDETEGVTIRYDRAQKAVEAIALYEVSKRAPAESKKIHQMPYAL